MLATFQIQARPAQDARRRAASSAWQEAARAGASCLASERALGWAYSPMAQVPLSVLDLAAVGPDESIADSFRGSVALARLAESAGYRRVW